MRVSLYLQRLQHWGNILVLSQGRLYGTAVHEDTTSCNWLSIDTVFSFLPFPVLSGETLLQTINTVLLFVCNIENKVLHNGVPRDFSWVIEVALYALWKCPFPSIYPLHNGVPREWGPNDDRMMMEWCSPLIILFQQLYILSIMVSHVKDLRMIV